MGGEGIMMQANKSLKQNRSLLKKRIDRKHQELYLSHHDKTPVEFTKLSLEEWKAYQAKQQEKFASEKRKSLKVNLFLFAAIFLLLSLMLYFFVFQ